MDDRSNGSACLLSALGNAPSQIRIPRSLSPQFGKRVSPPATRSRHACAGGAPSPSAREPAFAGRVRQARARLRRRAWVVRAGDAPASVPMWSSRAAWVDGLRSWATDAAVRQVCVRLDCSITSGTLLSIAIAMAPHADHATGRNMAAARATIAKQVGCDPRTVTTAWRVLGATGWAFEASRGHGGPGVPSIGRRTSIWHLTPRRETPAPVEFFHLPTPSGVGLLSPVVKNSTSARSCAHRPDQTQKPKRRYRAHTEPRPLALQRLAGQLAALAPVLGHGHIGTLCDALTTAGIDSQHWTAKQLKDALEADNWSWPDQIERPGGFLVSRLHRLTRGGTAASQDKRRAAGKPTPTPPAYVPEPHRPLSDAQKTQITAMQAEIRARLIAKRGKQPRSQKLPHRIVVSPSPAQIPAVAACTVCGSADAPRRRFMPATRAHICDMCW